MPKVPVLDLVQEFCTSVEFEEEFEGFAKEYAEIFQDSLECKSSDGEHPLQYYDAYRAYIQKFEKKISDFIEQNGSSLASFYGECEEALQDEDLFDAKRFFVEALLAVSEYPHFVVLMQSTVVKQRNARSSRK